MTIKIGFIGAGNMATAIMGGGMAAGILNSSNTFVYDINGSARLALASKYGASACGSMEELAQKADLLLLAVKPNAVPAVMESLKGHLSGKALVSIAAGTSLSKLASLADCDVRMLRIMPNTPLLVGAGASVFAKPCTLTEDEKSFIHKIFSSSGTVTEMDEKYLGAVTALSGSGPAYVYIMIEALADAGVKYGLTRADALMLAAKTVEGSGKMVLETGKHPAVLKDAVCSPGGTTIAGVAELERNGFRNALICAVDAAKEKADNM